MLTIRPNQTGNAQKTYSLPNLSGAVMATTNAAGTIISTYSYDPFGNKTSTSYPDNTASGSTLGWAGGAGRITEKDMALVPVQMGARVYFPTLGRFAQVDPIPGGTANDYTYPNDPINSNDFSGTLAVGNATASWKTSGGGFCLQSCGGFTEYIQPTINSSRGAEQTLQGPGARARGPINVPKAQTYNNSTALPQATVAQLISAAANSSRGNPVIGKMPSAPRDTTARTSGSFDVGRAASSAYDYAKVGSKVGALLGCVSFGVSGAIGGAVGGASAGFVAGAVPGAAAGWTVGCFAGGGYGSWAGGVAGGVTGWIMGGEGDYYGDKLNY
jgi:RHS repeat-associated protein